MDERIIFKYPLREQDKNEEGAYTLQMPKGSRVNTIHEQEGTVKLWASCKAKHRHKKKNRYFVIVPTGETFVSKRNLKYIGTCFKQDGTIWHVHESL